MEYQSELYSEAKVLKTVISEIEAIRGKRQQQYRDFQSHPSLKRFTQQELNDEAFSSYKNWLAGRSRRLPSRLTVLDIAEYLECTSSERNDLLIAAGYMPERYELQGGALQRALEQAQIIMNTLQLPAFIATQRFEIVEANQMFQLLYEVQFEKLPQRQRNMIQFHFNPEHSIRAHSTFSTEALQHWESHAMYGVDTFKQHNMYFRYDPWYRDMLNNYHSIGDFKTYWNQESIASENLISETKMLLARMGEDSEYVPIRLRQIHILVTSHMFPRIEAFLPEDEPARKLFAWLGSPVDRVIHPLQNI